MLKKLIIYYVFRTKMLLFTYDGVTSDPNHSISYPKLGNDEYNSNLSRCNRNNKETSELIKSNMKTLIRIIYL